MEGHTFNENGRYQYYLKGKGAHAMEPEKGINAGTYRQTLLVSILLIL